MFEIYEKNLIGYDYEREYNLNTMLNRIDLLIIKKNADAEYYLTMAYAYLYSTYKKNVKLDEITLLLAAFAYEGNTNETTGY